ncbi:hypothetical protein ASD02_20455 [Ensifer sp. Root1252]|nr:hypothetical protein ASD02_20455 [Ensifer sp. Root1252]KRC83038.1 hypothetical protein ASE32_23500 [Ensifer sp. Root231]KRC84911.1 hypothetical protein ASE47_17660 [Ensifer sp. Root258]
MTVAMLNTNTIEGGAVMSHQSINAERLLTRIRELGAIGRNDQGQLTRLAASDTDKLGRDRLVPRHRDYDSLTG